MTDDGVVERAPASPAAVPAVVHAQPTKQRLKGGIVRTDVDGDVVLTWLGTGSALSGVTIGGAGLLCGAFVGLHPVALALAPLILAGVVLVSLRTRVTIGMGRLIARSGPGAAFLDIDLAVDELESVFVRATATSWDLVAQLVGGEQKNIVVGIGSEDMAKVLEAEVAAALATSLRTRR